MRAAPSHAKEHKFTRIGRHSAPPSTARKVAQRAARIVPAAAAIGALGALPQVQHLLPGAPRPAGAQASLLMEDSAGSAQAGSAAAAGRGAYWSQHARGTAAVTAGRHLSATASPRPSATHRAKPAHSDPPGRHTRDSSPHPVNCTGGGGPLPQNYAAIVEFLTSHGYTGNAAAGIAGNIYQESGGNPESVGSGGGGLIGWTPLPGGFVTGDAAADLRTQLDAILTFNQQWAQYLPALNGAGSPAQAADIYVYDFERAGIPATANREAAASAVAAACGM